jgi:uncharacterized protein (DUF433 family)
MAQMQSIGMDVNGGFYTAAEAARLLGLPGAQRIVRWLSPTRGGRAPVIARSYLKVGQQHELSFLDLIEVRFVEHFRKQGISLQSLRVAADNARQELKVMHPFAMSNVKFQTDRKEIFLNAAQETGDRVFLNLMTKQLAIYTFIEDSLAKYLEFDITGLARSWRPAPNTAPDVLVSPAFAFGQPVISERYIPTATLFQAWKAEGGDFDSVADWYEVEVSDVRQAVEFELRPLH